VATSYQGFNLRLHWAERSTGTGLDYQPEEFGDLIGLQRRRDYSAGSNLLRPRAGCEARRLALAFDLP